MQNTIVLLLGFAGTGKYTVAKHLADASGAKIVDNHYVNNPIFGLIAQDGKTKLPSAVWDQVAAVRKAILDTIATLSPTSWNFVFTLDVIDRPDHVAIYNAIQAAARQRGARFFPVRLLCDAEELARRIVSPGRRERMKETDPQAAKDRFVREVVYQPPGKVLTIDTTALAPDEVARRVLKELGDAS